MLFRLQTGTPLSEIFTALNNEFIHFLERAITAKRFTRRLFSEDVGEVVWTNSKTKNRFQQLWKELKKLPENQRETIALAAKDHQEIADFFETLDIRPPTICASVFDCVEAVTHHLFNRTSHLVGIERLCTETINTHFNSFKAINGNVCCACGIHPLAEYRANVADADQWRSAFDHVLALNHFPVYGIHPKNLIPCCDHCNSKAKGGKNVIFGDDDRPRRAFYPHSECCHEHVALELEFGQFTLTPRMKWEGGDRAVQEKLDTWNDVYVIKDRIEGWLKEWIPMIDAECRAENLNQLRDRLSGQSQARMASPRYEGLSFWKGNFFNWASQLNDWNLQIILDAILSKRNDAELQGVFGL